MYAAVRRALERLIVSISVLRNPISFLSRASIGSEQYTSSLNGSDSRLHPSRVSACQGSSDEDNFVSTFETRTRTRRLTIIFWGSRSPLISLSRSTVDSPSSAWRYSSFPAPIPCSPVQVPIPRAAVSRELSQGRYCTHHQVVEPARPFDERVPRLCGVPRRC